MLKLEKLGGKITTWRLTGQVNMKMMKYGKTLNIAELLHA